MIVVLDCNILVMCLSSKSPYHIIYQHLIAGKFSIVVTNEILFEYEEIIQMKYGNSTAQSFLALLNELPNVHFINTFYKWLLMENDPDDNKYVDCAIAGKASYLITEDQHFNILNRISFPKINILSIDNFIELINPDL